MDTGAKSPGDWIDYGRQHYFDYRKENPDVETVDRDYQDNEANRAGRDFFPSIRTQQSQALAAHRAGVPLSPWLGYAVLRWDRQLHRVSYRRRVFTYGCDPCRDGR